MRGFRGLGARRSTLGTSVGCWMYVVRICRKTGHLACQRQLNLCCSSSTSANGCGRYVEFFYCIFVTRVWSGICVRICCFLSCFSPHARSRDLNQHGGPHDFPTRQTLYHSEFLDGGLVLSVITFLLPLLPMKTVHECGASFGRSCPCILFHTYHGAHL